MNDNEMNDNEMNDNPHPTPDATTRRMTAALLTEFDPGTRLAERLRLQQYSRNGIRELDILLQEKSTAITGSSFRSSRGSTISGSLAGAVQLNGSGADNVNVRVDFEGDLAVGIYFVVRIGRPAADPIGELSAVTSTGKVSLLRTEERRQVRWSATLPPGAFPTGVRPA